MRFNCAPEGHVCLSEQGTTPVILYGRNPPVGSGSAGAKIWEDLNRAHLQPSLRAWDFLSCALAVIAADHGNPRHTSPDGWTREFNLKIAVVDQAFWQGQAPSLEQTLGFLTTDIWRIEFVAGGSQPPRNGQAVRHGADCMTLLSGGLDSLIGALDLTSGGRTPFAVSQMVRTDSPNQQAYAVQLGLQERHLQLNHCVEIPNPEKPPSDRARSIIFYAYAIVLASCSTRAAASQALSLYVPENGLISLNVPLTPARIGSLSTKTTHPFVLRRLNELLRVGAFNMELLNPYQLKTKGEMLRQCRNQGILVALAAGSTSCGRFARYGRQHCGKCLPCLIRRAAFATWGQTDSTSYRFGDLSQHATNPRQYDDVRSAAMAVLKIERDGLNSWLGSSLNADYFNTTAEAAAAHDLVRRGMEELALLLRREGVL